MDAQRLFQVSKYLSKHLRHQPQALGLTLDEGGWVGVDDLIAACRSKHFYFTQDELREVVERNDKKRFAFDPTGTRIRASQGHTVAVDLQMEPQQPPAVLYHGTAARTVAAIKQEGLRRMKRNHVHLSPDYNTAHRVGSRHGRAVVLTVDAAAMHQAGYVFYCSENGVWLTEAVPVEYLQVPEAIPTAQQKDS